MQSIHLLVIPFPNTLENETFVGTGFAYTHYVSLREHGSGTYLTQLLNIVFLVKMHLQAGLFIPGAFWGYVVPK